MKTLPSNSTLPSTTIATTRYSVSAIISLTYGIMSFFVLATVFPTVITSLLAIILGHIAVVKIGRSQGQLLGRWQAITGLVLGYALLPLSLYLTPGFFSSPNPEVFDFSREMAFMQSAEDKILTSSGGSIHGNSPQAKQLAQKFGDQFDTLIQSRFVNVDKTGDAKKIEDTINVYCQLKADRICFLAKIARYHKYDDAARSELSALAWQTGMQTASQSNLPPGSKMGIGLRGRVLYGSVAIGDFDAGRPRKNNEKSRDLEAFFK